MTSTFSIGDGGNRNGQPGADIRSLVQMSFGQAQGLVRAAFFMVIFQSFLVQ